MSQPSLPAISSRLPRAPCSAQSRISKPSICTAVGALPAVTRARRTVMASVPPPPATGISVQLMPLPSRSFFRTSSAAASPPAVHQCRTSTFCLSCALAVTGAIAASIAQAAVPIAAILKNLCMCLPPVELYKTKFRRMLSSGIRPAHPEDRSICFETSIPLYFSQLLLRLTTLSFLNENHLQDKMCS
ncbi:hypothetical protein FQZ97_808040 [compost metagenome]